MAIISDWFGVVVLGTTAKNLSSGLGSSVLGSKDSKHLLVLGPRLLKATLDKGLVALVGIVCLPLILFISLLIFCSSSGPIFYQQPRIGLGAKPFRIWKFRSMVTDADQVLAQHLARHPQLQQDWDQNQKLKDDPRITRVGKFLRRSSLDELPQLWNVLKGEMSMVGPRPITQEEAWRYGDKFDDYLQVLPGITGLWQVSGRNNLTYDERVDLDTYYVRHWSARLDIYILMRTVKAVLVGDGAY